MRWVGYGRIGGAEMDSILILLTQGEWPDPHDKDRLSDEWRSARRAVLRHRREPLSPLLWAFFAMAGAMTLLMWFGGPGAGLAEAIGAAVVSAGAGIWFAISQREDFNAAVRAEMRRARAEGA